MASINAINFLTWIAYGLGTAVFTVWATEYNRIIIFKDPIPDKTFLGHVIRTEKVANEGSCRVECYLEPNCVSINVGPADEGKRTCELNNATDESPAQSALKERQYYIHYAVENVCHVHGDPCPRSNNLCQVGFTNKGYRCQCRKGYAGDGCKDVDECAEGSHDCHVNGTCKNTAGYYYCTCNKGYIGDGHWCTENWKIINNVPVCFGARDDSYGAFHITEFGKIYTFKLVHRSGSLRCRNDHTPSYWGCTHSFYGDKTLLTVIADRKNVVLSLANYRESGGDCRFYSYKMDGVGVNATELVFNNLPSPMTVSAGQEFRIWFGQDLMGCSEGNNSGETCADVYAWYA